jgi:hypothetical protein
MLAVLLLGLLLFGAWLWRRQRRQARQRARVWHELDQLVAQHEHDRAALASGLHQLLRRVARRHDAAAAQQRGAAWRQTLARVPLDSAALEQLLILEQAIYQPQLPFEQAATVAAVRRWLRLALQPAKWKPVTRPLASAERPHA